MTEAGYDAEVERLDAAALALDWNQHLRLFLPEPLESAFRRHQGIDAALRFRERSLLLLLLWLLLAGTVGVLLPASAHPLWFKCCSGVTFGFLAATVLARVPALTPWFSSYAGCAGSLAVALPLLANGLLRDPASASLTETAASLAIVAVYGLSGLRLGQAMAAGWIGGLAGVLLARALGGHVSGIVCLHACLSGNLLGMVLAYYQDHRGRAYFLQQRQIEQLTHEDALTGLPNRRHGEQALQREWRRAQREQRPLAVVMLDIDQFRRYNEALGVGQGDSLLRELAGIVGRFARRPGDVAARCGGDEFMLLLPDMLPDTADALAENLLETIRQSGFRQPGGLPLGVSLGVAVAVPFSDWQPQWLVDAAHRAMHEVRQEGGNNWRRSPFRVVAPVYAAG